MILLLFLTMLGNSQPEVGTARISSGLTMGHALAFLVQPGDVAQARIGFRMWNKFKSCLSARLKLSYPAPTPFEKR